MRVVYVSLAVLAVCLARPGAGRPNGAGSVQERVDEWLSNIHDFCPSEAAECGVPIEAAGNFDLSAFKATIQCLKQTALIDEVSEECVSAIEQRKDQARQTSQERRNERLSNMYAVCPVEAAECGLPTQVPDEPDFDVMRAAFQCFKEIVSSDEVSESCAAAIEERKQQISDRLGDLDNAQERRNERLSKIHAACPVEAASCGLPTEAPEERDFDAMRASFQCLKEITSSDEVSEECAAAIEEKKQQAVQTSQDRRNERLSNIHAACPVEAAECGLPTEVPEDPDFDVMRAALQCLKEITASDEVSEECAAAIEEKKQHMGRGRRASRSNRLDLRNRRGGRF